VWKVAPVGVHNFSHLLCEEHFYIFRCLINKYLVDMFSRDLESCMAYICADQHCLHCEDAFLTGISEEEASGDIYLMPPCSLPTANTSKL
jgi:hypothetical protein